MPKNNERKELIRLVEDMCELNAIILLKYAKALMKIGGFK